MYTDYGCKHWKEVPLPNDLRKFAALQSSAEFVDKLLIELCQMKYIDEGLYKRSSIEKEI
eukprot:1368395-Ditylum_brightwellii.AAC.1